jgi:hypothetical protein
MNHRLSKLLAQTSHTADKTEIIDIDYADPISALIIQMGGVYVGSDATAHGIACLKKLEIVDGSDVLYSLTGYEAEALDIYHNKRMPSNWNFYLNGGGCDRTVMINFGRKLWDPRFAFDPTKFKNPQLKITSDIDAGGNAPSSIHFAAFAAMFDEKKITPEGFLMAKEIKDYDMASAAHEYTDMPTDFPYRKLLIKALTAGTEPSSIIDNVKLSEEQDRKIIVDQAAHEILRSIASQNPQLVEQIYCYVGTSLTSVYTTISERAIATFVNFLATAATNSTCSYGAAGGRIRAIASGAVNTALIVAGWTPHGVYEIPFGDQDDPDDWYDVTKIGSLKLDIKAASGRSSSDHVQIFLQQLRHY